MCARGREIFCGADTTCPKANLFSKVLDPESTPKTIINGLMSILRNSHKNQDIEWTPDQYTAFNNQLLKMNSRRHKGYQLYKKSILSFIKKPIILQKKMEPEHETHSFLRKKWIRNMKNIDLGKRQCIRNMKTLIFTKANGSGAGNHYI